MSKALFVIASLGAGGSERFIHNLLSYEKFVDKFEDVQLLTVYPKSHDRYKLQGSFVHKSLNKNKVIFSLFSLIKSIREYQPDIVVCNSNRLSQLLLVARRFVNSKLMLIHPCIMSIRSKTKLEHFIDKILYNTNEVIHVCKSDFMKEDLKTYLNNDLLTVHCIYNPINTRKILKQMAVNDGIDQYFKSSGLQLLYVGRMHSDKGFDRLISALQYVKRDFTLHVLSNDCIPDTIQHEIEEKGLNNSIKEHGFQQNPFKFMSKADLIVLPSRTEGCSNVILEAGVCGVPVLAFDCPGSNKELIKGYGITVADGDEVEYAQELDSFSKDDFSSGEIQAHFRSLYSIDTISSEYFKLLGV